MSLDLFAPSTDRLIVFIAYSDLAWAMETNLIPAAETRLVINPENADYGFYSFGDNPPPGWYDCDLIPTYPILEIRANVARELYPQADWQNCSGAALPPDIEAMVEDTAFIRAWRKVAFAEEYTPFTAEEDPINNWLAILAEENIVIKLMRG